MNKRISAINKSSKYTVHNIKDVVSRNYNQINTNFSGNGTRIMSKYEDMIENKGKELANKIKLENIHNKTMSGLNKMGKFMVDEVTKPIQLSSSEFLSNYSYEELVDFADRLNDYIIQESFSREIPTKFEDHYSVGRKVKDLLWTTATPIGGNAAVAGKGNRLKGLAVDAVSTPVKAAAGTIGGIVGGAIGGVPGMLIGGGLGATAASIPAAAISRELRKGAYNLGNKKRIAELKKLNKKGKKYLIDKD